jgi:hypothetical protein
MTWCSRELPGRVPGPLRALRPAQLRELLLYQPRPRFRPSRVQHHWSGQEFELVTYLHTWSEHRAYFHKEGEHLVSVPATWTDIIAEDPVVQLAAGRALFRVTDLIELAQLLKGLRDQHVKEIMS